MQTFFFGIKGKFEISVFESTVAVKYLKLGSIHDKFVVLFFMKLQCFSSQLSLYSMTGWETFMT